MKFILTILTVCLFACISVHAVDSPSHHPTGGVDITNPRLILTMSDIALYHQAGRAPLKLGIAKVHADGSLDLVSAAGDIVVGQCPVSDRALPGHATRVLVDQTKPVVSEAVQTFRDRIAAGETVTVEELTKALKADELVNLADILNFEPPATGATKAELAAGLLAWVVAHPAK